MADKKKTLTKVVAVATAAALLLGGTFAWQSISQTALNEASDVINPGGRLHDDFYIDDEGNYNSDIYVENFAEDEIFARVRVEEFMEVVVNRGTAAENTVPVVGSKELKADAVVDPDNNPTGANLYDYTYETHYFGQDNATDEYWTLTPGSIDSETVYYMPTFNKNKDSLAVDRNGMYVDSVGGISDRGQGQYTDWYVWSDGEESTDLAIYDADSNDVDEYVDGSGVVDENWKEVEEIHIAQAVGVSDGLISMQEWMDLGSPEGAYWVYDTDGWVYWAQPIGAGQTTGLLLDEISLNKVMDDSWYYAINVVGQFITADDLGKSDNTGFYEDPDAVPSDNALTLLESIGVNTTGEENSTDTLQQLILNYAEDDVKTVQIGEKIEIVLDESDGNGYTGDISNISIMNDDTAEELDASQYTYENNILTITDDTAYGSKYRVADNTGIFAGRIVVGELILAESSILRLENVVNHEENYSGAFYDRILRNGEQWQMHPPKNDDEVVNWSISYIPTGYEYDDGGISTGTSISPDGLLTIAADEIYMEADPNRSGEQTFTIIEVAAELSNGEVETRRFLVAQYNLFVKMMFEHDEVITGNPLEVGVPYRYVYSGYSSIRNSIETTQVFADYIPLGDISEEYLGFDNPGVATITLNYDDFTDSANDRDVTDEYLTINDDGTITFKQQISKASGGRYLMHFDFEDDKFDTIVQIYTN